MHGYLSRTICSGLRECGFLFASLRFMIVALQLFGLFVCFLVSIALFRKTEKAPQSVGNFVLQFLAAVLLLVSLMVWVPLLLIVIIFDPNLDSVKWIGDKLNRK